MHDKPRIFFSFCSHSIRFYSTAEKKGIAFGRVLHAQLMFRVKWWRCWLPHAGYGYACMPYQNEYWCVAWQKSSGHIYNGKHTQKTTITTIKNILNIVEHCWTVFWSKCEAWHWAVRVGIYTRSLTNSIFCLSSMGSLCISVSFPFSSLRY